MCDYCGCRRQPAIDELSSEHDQLLDLAYALRRQAARTDHAAVSDVIERDLAPLLRRHTDKEERGLFRQLRTAWEADHRLDDLVSEHRTIDELLDRVHRGGEGWRDHLAVLTHTLTEHIMAEETDLFPYAMYELTDTQWDAVDEAHADDMTSPGHGLPAPVGSAPGCIR